MFEDDLEKLLDSLFEDESDISIIEIGTPIPKACGSCCTYSYTGYGG